jgi:RimJ/RimL family protein N-acetyltransferase
MIQFRSFTEEDIQQVVSWIYKSHVLDVWDSAQGVQSDVVEEKYMTRINSDVIDTYIIVINGVDVGLIQTYYIESHQDFGLTNEVAKGIDLFIGETDYINKGYGTRILKLFLQQYIFHQPEVQCACIDPELYNERAIRTYEKVGFKTVRVGYSEYSKLLTCYMLLKRSESKIKGLN